MTAPSGHFSPRWNSLTGATVVRGRVQEALLRRGELLIREKALLTFRKLRASLCMCRGRGRDSGRRDGSVCGGWSGLPLPVRSRLRYLDCPTVAPRLFVLGRARQSRERSIRIRLSDQFSLLKSCVLPALLPAWLPSHRVCLVLVVVSARRLLDQVGQPVLRLVHERLVFRIV